MGLQDVLKKDDFESLIKGDGLVVVHFYAEWAEQCSHMNEVMTELSNKPELKDVTFAKVLAEELPEVSLAYKISAVPTFILLRKSAEVDRVDGANAADLTQKVSKHASKVVLPPASPKVDLEARLKSLTHSAPVVLFMKGDKQEPKCGFSRTIVQLLNENNVTYKTFDILQDQQVREGLKKFSNWPTYPQLYINGELVGGLDIVKELISSGEFKEMVPKTESINDRLKKLVNKEPVMLFMKGNRNNPKCGFSRQIIEILNSTNVVYDTFDILEDEEVRQSLKEFSQWPTYPQLYVKGELIGGLDIVKEMQASGELAQSLNAEA